MTRFEQIAAAFPLHCQRIAECAYQDGALIHIMRGRPDQDGPAGALRGAFVWSRTEEGHDYWKTLADRVRK